MSRTPLLTTLLWTTVGVGALGACGEDPPAIVDAAPLDGMADAYVGPLVQFPSTLALTAACGVALPPAADLTVTNAGNAPLTISGATATGGFTVTTSFPVEVAAGSTTTIAVRPPAAVVGTDVGGMTRTGILSLNTNQPGTTGTVTLTSTIEGANLAFVDGDGQPVAQVDLTSSSGGCPPPSVVFIRNTGNLEAVLGGASTSGSFSVGGFSPSSTVAPGSTVSHDIGPFTTGACTAAATIDYQVTGTVCTTTPLALQANLNVSGSSFCFCS